MKLEVPSDRRQGTLLCILILKRTTCWTQFMLSNFAAKCRLELGIFEELSTTLHLLQQDHLLCSEGSQHLQSYLSPNSSSNLLGKFNTGWAAVLIELEILFVVFDNPAKGYSAMLAHCKLCLMLNSSIRKTNIHLFLAFEYLKFPLYKSLMFFCLIEFTC